MAGVHFEIDVRELAILNAQPRCRHGRTKQPCPRSRAVQALWHQGGRRQLL